MRSDCLRDAPIDVVIKGHAVDRWMLNTATKSDESDRRRRKLEHVAQGEGLTFLIGHPSVKGQVSMTRWLGPGGCASARRKGPSEK